MMENNKEIKPLSDIFDFSDVPSWYVLCTNSQCPLRDDCLRFVAGVHGAKLYYEYMRGERLLSPNQQQWIRNYVKSRGYDWEVEFDKYYEGYVFHHLALTTV